MNDSDKFFSGTSSEASRPRAVNPRTGQEQSWQRASNYAAPLDNPHGLIKWSLRELIKGLSLRPDLSRMLLTGAAIEDNAKADEIIVAAHATAAIDAKANEGTAVHAALSRSFLGHEIPAEYLPHVNAFAAELKRNGFTPVATELVLLNDRLGGHGHVDWVVKTADGRYVVLDVKTGKLGDARKFAVQCMVYAGAEYIDDGKGRNTFIPIPFEIDQTEAVLAHVDPQTGATALYRIDLTLGFYGATLAERVREWSKVEVLSPYVPVLTQSGAPVIYGQKIPAVGQRVDPTQPGSEVVSQQYAAAHPDLYEPSGVPIPAVPATDTVGGTPFVLPATSPTTAAVAPPTPSPVAVPAPTPSAIGSNLQAASAERIVAPDGALVKDRSTAVGPTEYNADARFTELMKLDKAPLQMIIKNTHGGTDLAHNRRWLARWIMAVEQGMSHPEAAKFAAMKDDAAPAPRIDANGVTQRPSTEPERQAGDLSFIFKSIEGAKSEGAIEALRANIVDRRGDQAWTDEMAAAARQRVAELLAAPGNAVDPALRILNKIRAATEQQHIADIWTDVTAGGSIPGAWTPDLDAAARAQVEEIQSAQPPPPANPFGA